MKCQEVRGQKVRGHSHAPQVMGPGGQRSWFKRSWDQGLKGHRSKIEIQEVKRWGLGSTARGQGFRVKGHGSWIKGLGSRSCVEGQESKLKGQWSRVKGTTLLTLPSLILRLPPPLTPLPMAQTPPHPASSATPNPTLSTTPNDAILGLQGWGYRVSVIGLASQESRLMGQRSRAPTTSHCHLPSSDCPLPSCHPTWGHRLHTLLPVAPLTTPWVS